MANQKPIVLLGTAPNFTGIGEMLTADRLEGIVNESDLTNNSVIARTGGGTITPIVLGANTLLGNSGSGVGALTGANIQTLLANITGLTTNGEILAFDGTDFQVITPGTNGQALVYNSAVNGGIEAASVASILNGLGDVTITAAATNDVLQYNGVDWVDLPLNVSQLGDVVTAGVADGWILEYNSGQWTAVAGGAGGDDLGNHTATQLLDMATFGIDNVGTLTFDSVIDVTSATWRIFHDAGDLSFNISGTDKLTIGSTTDITLPEYPSSRNDTGTFTPANFLYTNTNGVLYSSPVSDLGIPQNITDLVDVNDGVIPSDADVLTFNGATWEAQSPPTATFVSPADTNLNFFDGATYHNILNLNSLQFSPDPADQWVIGTSSAALVFTNAATQRLALNDTGDVVLNAYGSSRPNDGDGAVVNNLLYTSSTGLLSRVLLTDHVTSVADETTDELLFVNSTGDLERLSLANLPVFASAAAAVAGGVTAGQLWRASSANEMGVPQDTVLSGTDAVAVPGPQLAEGQQFATLWAAHRYGDAAGVEVPARAWAQNGAEFYAFTGNINDYALLDGGMAKIVASGEYETGSAEPRMYFKLALGEDYLGTPTQIYPEGGYVRGVVTPIAEIFEGGIEVSNLTHGENALAFDTKIFWNLEATVMFMGSNGIGDFATVGAANSGTVRVFGKLTFGKLPECRGGGGTQPGPIFGGVNESYTAFKSTGFSQYNQGTRVVCNGIPYEAIYDIPTATTTAISSWTDTDRSAMLEDMMRLTPGQGFEWRHHWLQVYNEVPFCFEEDVDLTQTGMALSLLVGGPHQTDEAKTFPAWDIATAYPLGFYAYANEGNTELDYEAEANGPFQPGERLTFSGSGAVAQLLFLNDQGATGTMFLDVVSGVPADGNTITGVTSGATATVSTGTVTTNAPRLVEKNGTVYVPRIAMAAGESAPEEYTVTYSTLVGSFTIGETVTFVGSGATGTIITDDGSTLTVDVTSGTPVDTDTLDGGTSSATADVDTVDNASANGWGRYWRALAADRRDKMKIYSSTAYLVGGRPGIGDHPLF